ncbi:MULTISPECIES: hypothetical protein [Pseudomonas]|uniref:hypothetical protein n=1 Tax=Pseudomonas TaxID=286 RepID=UPI001E3262D6|nr:MULTISPECIES: hypothetical protein [Pseudomonas]MCE1114002.1 hypothetical protein [Pseudomonas sp. NMI795_08]
MRTGAQASNLRAPSIGAGRILPAFADRSVNELGRLVNVLPARKTHVHPFSKTSSRMVVANPEKLAQLLPNSCGQSKKADSKDKKTAPER